MVHLIKKLTFNGHNDRYGYRQSTDTHMGIVDVTYAYNTGKATGVLRTTYE